MSVCEEREVEEEEKEEDGRGGGPPDRQRGCIAAEKNNLTSRLALTTSSSSQALLSRLNISDIIYRQHIPKTHTHIGSILGHGVTAALTPDSWNEGEAGRRDNSFPLPGTGSLQRAVGKP